MAKKIFNAYYEAKAINYRQMKSLGWAMLSLPWFAKL